MSVYLEDEILFDNLFVAGEFISKLPPFCLAQLNVIRVDEQTTHYQVCVYCFDDEIDCSDYL